MRATHSSIVSTALTARRHDAGVADHVGVGKVEDDQVVISHPRTHFIGDFAGAHLRLEIVRCHLRGRDDLSIFIGKGALDAAVKEISDVWIFFCLGDPELRFSLPRSRLRPKCS